MQRRALSQLVESTAKGAAAPRVFSGIQSTGVPHIGNYLGAIAQWRSLQDARSGPASDTLFCVVDLHSITVPQRRDVLERNTRDTLTALLACGLLPHKCLVFQQSMVPQHTELAWILGCVAPTGQLNRMTQWKDKARKQDAPCLGLYSYPVLQAADVLLYQAEVVPVGEDQQQHLELVRSIAAAFNHTFDSPMFALPKPIFSDAPRIKSLRDPLVKMSKSDRADASRINLNDDSDTIYSKIRKAVTDSESQITYEPERRPGVSNLLDIYAGFTRTSAETAVVGFSGLNTLQLKEATADAVIATLNPIRGEMARLAADEPYVSGVLHANGRAARALAEATMSRVRKAVGLAQL